MGTRYRGTDSEERALNAYIALARAQESVWAALALDLRGCDLTEGQFGALEALLHLGPLCQKELGRKLLRSGGNITVVVSNLERRGLVSRQVGEDRRFKTVRLTPAGRRLIAPLFQRHAAAIARLFAPLSPAEQERLRDLCRTLGLSAARAAAHPPTP